MNGVCSAPFFLVQLRRMLPKDFKAYCFAVALLPAISLEFVIAGHAADHAWSKHDIDTVYDAATAAAAKLNASQVEDLINLADALLKAGDSSLAKDALVTATALLEAPKDFMSTAAREEIIEKLSRLGDIQSAEALMDVDTTPEVKGAFLKAFGVGRAQAGDVAAALRAAEAISSLSKSTGPTRPGFDGLTLGIAQIGIELGRGGASEEALRIAGSLSNRVAKASIMAETAAAVCRATTVRGDDSTGGRGLAERAAEHAREAQASKERLFAIDPVQLAAEGIAWCEGPAAAKAFVSEAVPPPLADSLLARLADHFMANQRVDLAVVIAPRRNR